MRAIIGVLSRIYGQGDDRPFLRRYLISFGLGVAVAVCVLGALAIVRFGAASVGLDNAAWLAEAALAVVQWGAALALLITGCGCCCASPPRTRGGTGGSPSDRHCA